MSDSETNEDTETKGFIRQNLVSILIFAFSAIVTVSGWLITYNTTIGSMKAADADQITRIVKVEADVNRIDTTGSHALAMQKLITDQNAVAINDLKNDMKAANKDVAEIKANIAVINNKLDTIIETLKKTHP